MFDFQVTQNPGSISTNLTEIETALKEHLQGFNGIVVTQDTIKESKKDLAELRKLKDSIEDARKKVKKEWMQPYTEFEGRCKELVSLVDEPINAIDTQLKQFEEDRIAAKKEHIRELYVENIGEFATFLPFDSVFNPKWTNATSKDQDVIYDLSEKKLKVKTDLEAISALNSEIFDDLLDVYVNSGNNLTAAIQRHNQYLADKNKVIEQVKETTPEEIKPKAEAMGTLNDIVNLTKTVTFIISKDDAEDVENLLKVSGISYRIMEG